MDLRAVPLVLGDIRLEPLADAHVEPLRAACAADPEIWAIYPYSLFGEHFGPSLAAIRRRQQTGAQLPFPVLVAGEVVGMTTYIAPDSANASVEVGGTYYRPDVRGGTVNPACKRLMLGHAFEAGARRVAFRVDAVNARSRAAMLKLGAVQEGVLRQERVTWTGRVRDTVVFSMLAEEWPAVRDRLDARLAPHGARASSPAQPA